MQNNDDFDVSIIQPVVNYCGNCGDNGFPDKWSMEPWNCCIAGMTWTGKNVVLKSGAQVDAYMYIEGGNIVIGQTDIATNNNTEMTVKDDRRTFDWVAATLEEYSVVECSSYTQQPFNMTKMNIVQADGTVVTPKWKETGQAKCKGGVVIEDPLNVQVYGANMP